MRAKLLLILICFIAAGLACPFQLFADNGDPPKPEENYRVMPEVKVTASRIASTTGTVILDKELIDSLPQRNGSINEIIGTVPGVQFNESYQNSFQAGEISPPNISISGSRYYDNNFTIDGIGNNSAIDPVNDTYEDASSLPGHPQLHVLDSHLAEQVTVYNSNIPAEFGGFTGGLVDVQTLDPQPDFFGSLNYKTTRANWTSFHIAPNDGATFYNSTSTKFEPNFDKYMAGLNINIPFGRHTAVIAAYQQRYSKISLQHLGTEKNQSRRLENLFLKLTHHLSPSFKLTGSFLASPESSHYFLKDFRNSDFHLTKDNYLLGLSGEKQTAVGAAFFTLALNSQEHKRDAKLNRYFWNTSTPSIDWESGKEGSIGRLETEQNDFSLKLALELKPVRLGKTEHLIKIGSESSYSRQHYQRPETSYYYYSPILYNDATFVCTPDDPACIDGEQYLSRRTVYERTDATAEVAENAFFLQDTLTWKNLELFPGLRLSHNDMTQDLNLAPRFSAALDLFGNRETVIFAGKNRYYSGTLLTYRLYEARINANQVRSTADNAPDSWTSTVPNTYVGSDLKTPYTDEITFGVIQRVLGGQFKLQYLNKKGRDEFALTRESGPTRFSLNNNGRSKHESCQASWQRSWGGHSIEINATWQSTDTSNLDQDERIDDSNISETVWYQGEELYYDELPRIDYNRRLVANLVYIGQFPFNISFTNIIKYRDGYERLKNTGQMQQSVVDPAQMSWIYEKQTNKSSIIFDWRLSWELPGFSDQQPILHADLLNVFDRRVPVKYYTDEFELGRQLWVGIDFNF